MHRTNLLAALTAPCLAAAAFAGPLTPPAGPVAPSMRTLQQVEPRTPISAATTPGDASSLYKITQSGSYYLTGDITGVPGKSGIEIDADNVTIDLGGFTLRGVPGAYSGVIDRDNEELPLVRHLVLHGGVIESWPQYGANLLLTDGGRISDLAVRGNNYGLRATGSFNIRHVRAAHNTWTGIETEGGSIITECAADHNHTGFLGGGTTYENCTARYNTDTGFSASSSALRACTAEGNAQINIEAGHSMVTGCFAYAGQVGVEANYGTTVQGCVVYSASLCGIAVANHNTQITGNRITACGAGGAPSAAIHVPAFIENAHIEGNTGTANARGVSILGTNCLVLRNTFGRPVQNHLNYFIAAGNRVAPIAYAGTNAAQVSPPGSSTYAGSFTATDPNANLSY